jgi:hypothetical protein
VSSRRGALVRDGGEEHQVLLQPRLQPAGIGVSASGTNGAHGKAKSVVASEGRLLRALLELALVLQLQDGEDHGLVLIQQLRDARRKGKEATPCAC